MSKRELNKQIQKNFKDLQFYDKYGFLPFKKKRIDITINGHAYEKLQKVKNKSAFIEKLILEN